jgi:hypothetical protein
MSKDIENRFVLRERETRLRKSHENCQTYFFFLSWFFRKFRADSTMLSQFVALRLRIGLIPKSPEKAWLLPVLPKADQLAVGEFMPK